MRVLLLCLVLIPLAAPHAAPETADRITAVGSDTLSELMTRWIQAFRQGHPRTVVQMQNPGSGSAPQALMTGASNLGPMSRAMHANEVAAFTQRFGYEPTAVRVANDAIGIFVHAENPLRKLDLGEIDAVFSSTRWCQGLPAREDWAAIGVSGPLAGRPLIRLGRNSASGTYEFFQAQVLCGGDLRPDVLQIPGSPAILQLLASTPAGIAYASAGTRMPGVRALELGHAGEPIGPTRENVMQGRYPLSRPLYLYVNRAPGTALPASLDAFLRFALSPEGQDIVAASGYFPLSPDQLIMERERLNLDRPPVP